jgi:hypothetical protein
MKTWRPNIDPSGGSALSGRPDERELGAVHAIAVAQGRALRRARGRARSLEVADVVTQVAKGDGATNAVDAQVAGRSVNRSHVMHDYVTGPSSLVVSRLPPRDWSLASDLR